jgi:GNAT superfamily N-acetyltransferase
MRMGWPVRLGNASFPSNCLQGRTYSLNFMGITIVDADPTRDRELLVETLSRFLTPLSDGRRFDWLYKSNPEGVARAWLAIDTETKRVVGTAAAFPRRCYLGLDEMPAWVLGDFCFDPEYRSLGPALQLQRACLSVTKSDGGMFCYDFPNASMVAVYKRLGFPITQKILRFAKLLRIDRRVRELLNVPIARDVVSALGNTLLKLIATKIVMDPFLELSIHQGRCGEEFSDLASNQGSRLGTCIKRSADYLNWRYVSYPLASYEIMTARQHGKLKGYVIWTHAGEEASVVDLFGHNDSAMVRALLAGVIGRLTTRGVTTLSVWLSESHPWIPACSEMGFRARDFLPLICVPGPAGVNLAGVKTTKWFIMHGDRDS